MEIAALPFQFRGCSYEDAGPVIFLIITIVERFTFD
jgi:hypothetical protein